MSLHTVLPLPGWLVSGSCQLMCCSKRGRQICQDLRADSSLGRSIGRLDAVVSEAAGRIGCQRGGGVWCDGDIVRVAAIADGFHGRLAAWAQGQADEASDSDQQTGNQFGHILGMYCTVQGAGRLPTAPEQSAQYMHPGHITHGKKGTV